MEREQPRRKHESWREALWWAKHGRSPGRSPWFLPICDETGRCLGRLQPVRQEEADSPATLLALTRWRAANSDKFLTQFTPTVERTRRWLTTVVLPDDTRILFLICDETGQPVGNIGLCNMSDSSVELDNVLRGERDGAAGLVYFSTLALLDWAFQQLNVASIWLHVFLGNERAIRLYQKVGFVEAGCRPLWKTIMHGDLRLVTDPVDGAVASELALLRMELTSEEFAGRHAWMRAGKEAISWSR